MAQLRAIDDVCARQRWVGGLRLVVVVSRHFRPLPPLSSKAQIQPSIHTRHSPAVDDLRVLQPLGGDEPARVYGVKLLGWGGVGVGA